MNKCISCDSIYFRFQEIKHMNSSMDNQINKQTNNQRTPASKKQKQKKRKQIQINKDTKPSLIHRINEPKSKNKSEQRSPFEARPNLKVFDSAVFVSESLDEQYHGVVAVIVVPGQRFLGRKGY